MHPARPGHKQHRAPNSGEEDSRATVGLNKDQTEYQRDDGTRQKDTAFPGLHMALAAIAIPRHDDNERNLGKFRRLVAEAVKIEPAAGAVDFPADMRDKDCN